jgi:hypothetical protein
MPLDHAGFQESGLALVLVQPQTPHERSLSHYLSTAWT